MIYILTGPVGSGKSSALRVWTTDLKTVGGVLSYTKDGLRQLESIGTKEIFQFEVEDDYDGDVLSVGRFLFSAHSFEKAAEVIWSAFNNNHCHCVIIDEIGKLELKDLGFSHILKKCVLELNNDKGTEKDLILVVRDYLVQDAIDYFGIEEHRILKKQDLPGLSY